MQMCTKLIRKTILSTRNEARESEKRRGFASRQGWAKKINFYVSKALLLSRTVLSVFITLISICRWLCIISNGSLWISILSCCLFTYQQHLNTFPALPESVLWFFILFCKFVWILFRSCQVPLGCDSLESMAIKTINKRIEAFFYDSRCACWDGSAQNQHKPKVNITLVSVFKSFSSIGTFKRNAFVSISSCYWKKLINLKAGENRIYFFFVPESFQGKSH